MLTSLAAAVAATVLVAMGARAVMSRVSCTDHPVVAHIAVSGDIAPVVQRVGAYFNREHRLVRGHCAAVAVQAVPPAAVVASLTGKAAGHTQPADAWIPDSPLWVALARSSPAGAKLVQPTPITVARSALVIAMPRAAAARTPAYGTTVSWRLLFPHSIGGPAPGLGLHVQFPDPTRTGTGLTTLVALRKLLGPGRAARFALAESVFNVQVVPPGEGGTSLPPLTALARRAGKGSNAAPVTVTSEHAVVAFDQAHPGQPLAIRYPAEGTYELSYPYTLTGSSPLLLAVARQFGSALQSPYATAYVRYEGFRSAAGTLGGWPPAFGLATHPPLLPPPGPAQAGKAMRAWQRLSLGSRLLALIDVSSVMATPAVPGGPTLEEVFAKTASIGLARLPDSTQLGLWAFASHLQGSLPYRQLVPVGPLPGPFGLVSRRQQVQRLASAAVPVPGAGAALYGTILAAYRNMVANYQPRYTNTVILLTAGVENAPGDISAAHLVQELKLLYNPQQRIQIIAIMLGRAGNFSVMRQVADATHGKAYDLTDPTQINQVFYQAMGRRICAPHCPGPKHGR